MAAYPEVTAFVTLFRDREGALIAVIGLGEAYNSEAGGQQVSLETAGKKIIRAFLAQPELSGGKSKWMFVTKPDDVSDAEAYDMAAKAVEGRLKELDSSSSEVRTKRLKRV